MAAMLDGLTIYIGECLTLHFQSQITANTPCRQNGGMKTVISCHLTLITTSSQIVGKTSVNVTTDSSSKDYTLFWTALFANLFTNSNF